MVLSFSCYNSLGGEVVRGGRVLRAGCRADPRTGSKAPVEAALGTEKDKYNNKYKFRFRFRYTTWQRQLGLQPESPGRAFLPSTAAQSPGRNAWERWEK